VLGEKPRAAGKSADRPTTQEYLQPTTRLVKPFGNVVQGINYFFSHPTYSRSVSYIREHQLSRVTILTTALHCWHHREPKVTSANKRVPVALPQRF
jgi:hypothetical protein